jgi:hypothetical protein
LLLVFVWLLSTETGLQTSWFVLRPFIPGSIQVGQLQGRWLGTITAHNLDYLPPKGWPISRLHIQQIDIRLSPFAVLEHQFRIEQLALLQADITFADAIKKQQAPLSIQYLKLSSGLSLSHPTTIQVQLSKVAGKSGKNTFWGQADFSIQNGIPYLGIVQLRYADQKWQFIPKTPNHPQKKTTHPVAGVITWKRNAHSPIFKADIFQRVTQKPKTIEWQLPHFPLKALAFMLPNNIRWDSEVNLRIQYHGPAKKKTGHITLKAVFPSGNILFRDTPYSWIKCPYEEVSISSNIVSSNHWSLDAHVSGFKTYLPTQGIALQSGTLNIHSAHHPKQKPLFSAEGKLGIGQSWLYLSSNAFNTWTLKGDDLPLYRTYALTATASPNLTLHYIPPVLHIHGDLGVSKATIRLKEQVNQSVLSRDVRFIDALDTNKKGDIGQNNTIHILPDIQLLLKNITLQGYGLEGKLEGNLAVTKRHDGVLTGKGELWIDKGRYRLKGKTRTINKGRLYFPNGTLLSDPLLDIRITERNPMQQDATQENNFYIQGTLTRPMVQLYNTRQKNVQFLSSTNDNPNAQTLLASQSALFLADAAGNNEGSFIDRLQNRLHVEDIDVEARHTTYNPKTHTDMDTVLTVGSYLTPKVYLQYLKSMLEETKTVKLKYFLGRYWSIGVETGTEGSGSDISFSMDKE